MLNLEVYDRNKVVYSYILQYERYESFWGATYDDYLTWLSLTSKYSDLEKQCSIRRIQFALQLQFPNHHYRFVKDGKILQR